MPALSRRAALSFPAVALVASPVEATPGDDAAVVAACAEFVERRRRFYALSPGADADATDCAWAGYSASLDAVLQLPSESKRDLPFVITIEPASEEAVQEAVATMAELDFMVEPPLALPMERPL